MKNDVFHFVLIHLDLSSSDLLIWSNNMFKRVISVVSRTVEMMLKPEDSPSTLIYIHLIMVFM